MKKRMSSKSIQKKILISFSIILAISFIAIGMTASYLIMQHAQETAISHSEQILALVSENMGQIIDIVDNTSKQVVLSEQAVEYCINSGEMSEYERIRSESELGKELAANTLHSNQFICSLILYPKEGYCISFGEIQYMTTNKYDEWPVYKTGMERKEPTWFAVREVQAAYGKEEVISFTRPIYINGGGETVGLLELQIPAETMSASLERLDTADESGVLLLDGDGKSVIPEFGELGKSGELLKVAQQLKKKSQNVQIKIDGAVYVLNCSVLKNKWMLVHYQPLKNLTRTAVAVVRLILVAGVLMLFLLIILSRCISYQLIQPIKKVIDVTRDMDETVEPTGSEYEVMALFDNYNMMMRRIRESELDTLRAQITPHFLYNTLNSIKCKALVDGNPDVAKMTQWLINLLELSINNRNEYVTLTEELDMLQSYVGLQKARSDKEFLFQTELLSEKLGKCLIPKMILQTLVENAILHGIEEKEYSDSENGAVISVRASLCGEDLQIEVSDNGIGMSEERIKEVFSAGQSDEKRKMNRVGLYNVDQRIKLYFGKTYGLSIKSTQGHGTAVTIRMPCTEKPEAFRREL